MKIFYNNNNNLNIIIKSFHKYFKLNFYKKSKPHLI